MNNDAEKLKRVATLFDDLHDLTAAARADRLTALRIAEPHVAFELSRWIAKDEQSQGMLDSLTQDHPGSTEPAPATPSDRSGQHIGAYQLLRRVGRGGMGEVYEARRPGADFEQKVAIKLLRRGLDSEDIVRRFLRERRILAQLEHPGIARLIDGGLSDDGLPFLVMEFVDGSGLIEVANALALDVNARLTLFLQICDAVAYAHRRLIVHRDLKPSNVLLTVDNQPKLLDFGIAKLLDETDDEHLTGTGMRVLTPNYAAPEQILGRPISTATDVYALGVILYELLTGTSPHQRRGKDLERVTRDLDQESLTRPSAAVLRSESSGSTTHPQQQRLARQLSGDLDTIVLHALKREPERRYQGAAELADDIRRYLNGHPVRAETDTLNYRVRKFVKRHRGGVTAAVLAVLGIVAGLVIALWQANLARHSAARAEVEAARAEREAAAAVESASRTKRVKDFMMETFVHADPLRSAADAPKTVAQAVDAALARVDHDMGDDPKLQIDLLDDFGEIRTGQGRFDEAQKLFDRALAQAEKTYGPDHPVVAESLLNRASIEIYSERTLAAAPLVERAIAILEANSELDPLALVNGLSYLQAVREGQGRREEALKLIRRAIDIQRQFGKPGDPALSMTLANFGTALFNLGRLAESEQPFREAIAEMEKSFGADYPGLESSLSGLSEVLYRRSEIAESIALNKRRLRIARNVYSGAHPWIANVLTDLAWQSQELGNSKEAFAQYDEAIAIYTTLASDEVIHPLRDRAIAMSRGKDHAGALATIDLAWKICQERPLDHPYCALIRGNRAGILARLGRADDALVEADAAMADLNKFNMASSHDMAQAMESKSFALKSLGRQAEAQTVLQEALAIHVKVYGDAHPETQRVRRQFDAVSKSPGTPQ